MSEDASPSRSGSTGGGGVRGLYVRVLLRLLPPLLSLSRHVSPKIRAEVGYLKPGYTFQLTVNGTNLSCVCRRTEKGSFKRVPPARLARDVVHRRLLVGVAREYGEARVQHDVLPIFGQREELLVHVAPSFPDAPVGRRPIAWSPLTRSVNDARAAYHH